MAGILDGLLGSGDPNDPKTQGILALALGLMQAGGPSRTPVSLGQAVGSAGMGGLQAYQSAIDTGLKRKLTQAQLEDIQQQAQLRNQQMLFAQQRNDWIQKAIDESQNLFPSNSSVAMNRSAQTTAPVNPNLPSWAQSAAGVRQNEGPTPQAAQTLSSLPPNIAQRLSPLDRQAYLMALGSGDLGKAADMRQNAFGFKFTPEGLATRFNPDTQQIETVPGSLKTIGDITYAKGTAQKAAENQGTMAPPSTFMIKDPNDPTKSVPFFGTLDQLIGLTKGQQGAQRTISGPSTPKLQTPFEAEAQKSTLALAQKEGEDLLANKRSIYSQATTQLPAIQRIIDSVQKGAVQGQYQEPRKMALEVARLFNITDKEMNDTLDRTGSAAQAIAELARGKLKSYGTNPSNIDLINQKIAQGSLTDSPSALYMIMNAIQADLYNNVVEHNNQVSGWKADHPEMTSRINNYQINTKLIPHFSIDGGLFKLNTDTGFFEPTGSTQGDYKMPGVGITGSRSTTSKKVLKYNQQTGELE